MPVVPAPDGALDNCSANYKLSTIRPQTEHTQPRGHRGAREVGQSEKDRKLWRNGEAWARDLSSEAGIDRH